MRPTGKEQAVKDFKYECELIRDLLPLYHDSVCSEVTREAVDEHLSECEECEAVYKEMLSADRLEPRPGDAEKRQADSIRMVRSRNTWRAIVLGSATFLVISALILAVCRWMTLARVTVPEDLITEVTVDHFRFGPEDNFVFTYDWEKYPKFNSAEDSSTVFIGSSVEIDGEMEYILCMTMDITLWDYLTADPDPWKDMDPYARAMTIQAISDFNFTPAYWEFWSHGDNSGYYGDMPSISMRESTECFFTRVYLFQKYTDYEDFRELVSINDPGMSRHVMNEQKLEFLEGKAVLLWEN